MKYLSKILFFISSFNILPPVREVQDAVLKLVDTQFNSADEFVRNSLKQFACHGHYYKKRFWFTFNLISLFAVVPLLLLLIIRGLFFVDKCESKKNRISLSLVGFDDLKNLNITKVNKAFGYLKFSDYKFIFKILTVGWYRPYFLLRGVWKIGVYSQLMDRYNPSEVWVNQEMVFESSLLTNYLKSFDVKHVNCMHGDNFYSIQIAYSSFSKFYIWDDYYRRVFEMLRISADEYCVFDPMPSTDKDKNVNTGNIFKYFSQHSANQKEFQQLIKKLTLVSSKLECKLVVRLHPLHKQKYEVEILKQYGVEIENNATKNIIASLQECSYVCSAFSTVIYQAHRLNKHVIIDNTNSEDFNLIKDLEPIYLKKYYSDLLVNY